MVVVILFAGACSFVGQSDSGGGGQSKPETVRYANELPKCLADIPTPAGATIVGGSEQFRNGERFYCQGSMAFGASVDEAEATLLKLWRAAGIRFRPAEQRVEGSSLILMEQPCGLLNITQPNKEKPATIGITLIPDEGCPYIAKPGQ